jgi:trehalose-6-phosphatase
MLMLLSKAGGGLNRFDSRSDIQVWAPIQRWLSKKGFDFILTLEDDSTDEEIFAVLPRQAYSIHVEPLRVTLDRTCMALG